MLYAVNRPRSIFAESLRMIAASADNECSAQGSKIIGVLSVLQKEGKSLVAANLAALLATEGTKTLLVDADLKNPTISKVLAPNARSGLLEVLAGGQSWSEAVCRVANSEMLLIPTVPGPCPTGVSRIAMHDCFGQALHDVTKCFDYVIVDLSRVGAGGNTNFLAGKVDCILLVVEWGRTPREVVKDVLASNEAVANRCIGVIVNRVDLNRLRLYEDRVEDSEAAVLS
jgi:succinoglycan biosynthesis transport protein ExoP